jgi:hypothetical protein
VNNPAAIARLRALTAIIERDRIVAEAPPIPDSPEERLRLYREITSRPVDIELPDDPQERLDMYRRMIGKE